MLLFFSTCSFNVSDSSIPEATIATKCNFEQQLPLTAPSGDYTDVFRTLAEYASTASIQLQRNSQVKLVNGSLQWSMPTCLQTLASYYLSGSKTFRNTNQKLRVFTLKVKFVLTFFKRRNVYFEDKWCPFPVCVSVFTAQRVAGKCLQTRQRVPCELRLLANSAITRTYLQRNFFPCDWGFHNN